MNYEKIHDIGKALIELAERSDLSDQFIRNELARLEYELGHCGQHKKNSLWHFLRENEKEQVWASHYGENPRYKRFPRDWTAEECLEALEDDDFMGTGG